MLEGRLGRPRPPRVASSAARRPRPAVPDKTTSDLSTGSRHRSVRGSPAGDGPECRLRHLPPRPLMQYVGRTWATSPRISRGPSPRRCPAAPSNRSRPARRGADAPAVLALQRSAGNRVARAHHQRVRRMPASSLASRSRTVRGHAGEAQRPEQPAAQRGGDHRPGPRGLPVLQDDDDLDGCKRVLRGLASAGGDWAKDALDFAKARPTRTSRTPFSAASEWAEGTASRTSSSTSAASSVSRSPARRPARAPAWLDANTPKVLRRGAQEGRRGRLDQRALRRLKSVTQTSLHLRRTCSRGTSTSTRPADVVPDEIGKVAGLQWTRARRRSRGRLRRLGRLGMQLFRRWAGPGSAHVDRPPTRAAGHAVALLAAPTAHRSRTCSAALALRDDQATTDDDAEAAPCSISGLDIYAEPEARAPAASFLPPGRRRDARSSMRA